MQNAAEVNGREQKRAKNAADKATAADAAATTKLR